jgi:hypothetical protein
VKNGNCSKHKVYVFDRNLGLAEAYRTPNISRTERSETIGSSSSSQAFSGASSWSVKGWLRMAAVWVLSKARVVRARWRELTESEDGSAAADLGRLNIRKEVPVHRDVPDAVCLSKQAHHGKSAFQLENEKIPGLRPSCIRFSSLIILLRRWHINPATRRLHLLDNLGSFLIFPVDAI